MKQLKYYTLVLLLCSLTLFTGCFGNAEGYGGYKPGSGTTNTAPAQPSGNSTAMVADSWFLYSSTSNPSCQSSNLPMNEGILSPTANIESYVVQKDLCSAPQLVSVTELRFSRDKSIVLYKNNIYQRASIGHAVKIFCFANDIANNASVELFITKSDSVYTAYASYSEQNVVDSQSGVVQKSETTLALEYVYGSEIILEVSKPLVVPFTKGNLRLKLPHSAPMDVEMQCRITEPTLLD